MAASLKREIKAPVGPDPVDLNTWTGSNPAPATPDGEPIPRMSDNGSLANNHTYNHIF
jgi:hypothetical protein